MTKPKPALDRALLDAELTDCRAQRDAAQRQLAQAQQSANNAVTNIARCDGAEAQLLALIAKLEIPNEAPAPAP